MKIISFELAKQAKEAGFDWPVDMRYNSKGELLGCKLGMHRQPNRYEDNYSAPNMETLLTWFREKHNIHIWVQPIIPGIPEYESYKDHKYIYFIFQDDNFVVSGAIKGGTWEEHKEEALKEGILAIKY